MKRTGVMLCMGIVAAGCATEKTYEINFGEAEGFDWDGKLRVTKTTESHTGPFLIVENTTTVDRIELTSRDGRTAVVSTEGYKDIPIAEIALNPPQGMQVLGTRVVWQAPVTVMVVEGDCPVSPGNAIDSEDSKPSTPSPLRVREPKLDQRPYARHVDDLDLADWWAIGQSEADHVRLEYHVPEEGLRIVVQGKVPGHGPETLEVFTDDGRLLKKYERQPVQVIEFTPPPVQ